MLNVTVNFPHLRLAVDQTLLNHFIIAEPQIGNICRAESQDILERVANFTDPKVHTDALQQFN